MKTSVKLIVVGLIILTCFGLGKAFLSDGVYLISRSAMINKPASKVYAMLASPKAWQAWSPWKEADPDMTTTYEGPEQGVGAISRWTGQDGAGWLVITSAKEFNEVLYDLHLVDMEMSSKGGFTLVDNGQSTELTWFDGGVANGLMQKFFVTWFLDGMLGAQFERGFELLNAQP